MYLKYYNLKIEPFSVTPDPDFLFLSSGHREALASVAYSITQRRGFVSLIGEVGTGKTTILRAVLERLNDQRIQSIYLFNSNISMMELMGTMLSNPESNTHGGLLQQLQEALLRQYRKGRNVVLIVDEAQNMPIQTLEDLRVLSNLETSKDKLIQIVLSGQPELEEKLNLHRLRQLKQRIALRATTPTFTSHECYAYIQHRLSTAGLPEGHVFTLGAYRCLIQNSSGNPRLLNILCDNALVSGYGSQTKPVSSRIAREVVSTFRGESEEAILEVSPIFWKSTGNGADCNAAL